MNREPNRSKQRRPRQRKSLTAVFRISAVVLVCCFAAIVGFPNTMGHTWVYWVALGAAFVCAVTAAVLKKLDGEEAADDAAWLLRFRDRSSKQSWDIDIGD